MCMYVCLVISATPSSVAAAESRQTDRQQSDCPQIDRQVTKAVRSSESDSELQTLQQSAVGDIKTVSVATLASSDLRSN